MHISPGYAVRKDFTESERVAIGRAIEESLAGRRGGDTSTGEQRNPQNFADCKGKESSEIAAQKAGFNNKETYRVAIGRAIERSLGNRQGQRTDLQPRQNFGEVNAKRTDEIAAQKAGFNNKETYRVAIGRAIEESLGNRQGQRTDLEPVQNFAQVEGKKTIEIAAQKAGFNNKETYRVAIGRAIEESLAGRRGRPPKEENVENFPQFSDDSTDEQRNVQNFAQCKSEKSRMRMCP